MQLEKSLRSSEDPAQPKIKTTTTKKNPNNLIIMLLQIFHWQNCMKLALLVSIDECEVLLFGGKFDDHCQNT